MDPTNPQRSSMVNTKVHERPSPDSITDGRAPQRQRLDDHSRVAQLVNTDPAQPPYPLVYRHRPLPHSISRSIYDQPLVSGPARRDQFGQTTQLQAWAERSLGGVQGGSRAEQDAQRSSQNAQLEGAHDLLRLGRMASTESNEPNREALLAETRHSTSIRIPAEGPINDQHRASQASYPDTRMAGHRRTNQLGDQGIPAQTSHSRSLPQPYLSNDQKVPVYFDKRPSQLGSNNFNSAGSAMAGPPYMGPGGFQADLTASHSGTRPITYQPNTGTASHPVNPDQMTMPTSLSTSAIPTESATSGHGGLQVSTSEKRINPISAQTFWRPMNSATYRPVHGRPVNSAIYRPPAHERTVNPATYRPPAHERTVNPATYRPPVHERPVNPATYRPPVHRRTVNPATYRPPVYGLHPQDSLPEISLSSSQLLIGATVFSGPVASLPANSTLTAGSRVGSHLLPAPQIVTEAPTSNTARGNLRAAVSSRHDRSLPVPQAGTSTTVGSPPSLPDWVERNRKIQAAADRIKSQYVPRFAGGVEREHADRRCSALISEITGLLFRAQTNELIVEIRSTVNHLMEINLWALRHAHSMLLSTLADDVVRVSLQLHQRSQLDHPLSVRTVAVIILAMTYLYPADHDEHALRLQPIRVRLSQLEGLLPGGR